MKHIYYLLLTFITSQIAYGNSLWAQPLSENARISLITCSPSDDDVYTLYGHSAIRVNDPMSRLDVVFNYGIFDFSKPNFIYRFAKGETDYMLRAYDFKAFIVEYISRGSEISEQVLSLLPEEREALWQALSLNERPENRVYRYNFFFDNCATRPAVMIEKNIAGKLLFVQPQEAEPSFRNVINHCTRNHPWVTFGCDLVLGLPTDRQMTFRERFFLPHFLKEAFATATVQRDDNATEQAKYQPTTHRICEQISILNNADKTEEEKDAEYQTVWNRLTSPFTCSVLFLMLFLLLTMAERRNKKHYWAADCLLFTVAGIAGCILFFLSFLSVHPSIFPNISVLWLHPLHLVAAALMAFKRQIRWYHIFNVIAITLMSIVWFFVPQHFNLAFAPLIATLWIRSAVRIYGSLCRYR